MEIQLRPYQLQTIQALRSKIPSGNRIVMVAPTGAGKTVMFSYMVKSAFERGKRILILTDRKELFQQADSSLVRFGLQPIQINPLNKLKSFTGRLYVAMSQTLSRRIEKYSELLLSFDLVIVDEAHKTAFDTILNALPATTTIIGATATPYRDGKQSAMDEIYNNIVQEVDVPELIQTGFLSTPHTFAVPINLSSVRTVKGDYDEKQMGKMFDENKVYGGVIDNYKRICNNRKAIIFASNVESSELIVQEFIKQGYQARHVDCYMTDSDRKSTLKWFSETPGAILSNYGILTTGFDEPTIEVVILYRATKSLPLFLQMVGRGSRVTDTKKDFILLDFGNNVATHGFWEQPREWSLKKKSKREGAAPVRNCECGAMLAVSITECPYCGHQFPKSEKEIVDEKIAELVLMRGVDFSKLNFTELEAYANAKGYKKGWIFHQVKTREQIHEYAKFKGYSQKWVNYQLQIK